ncbi:MAG: flagellar hook-basal body complex protein [Burkholderiaceae bacterium]|nr:flagellar hook-basal body complex protein [Burkholderiaceae bacterium]
MLESLYAGLTGLATFSKGLNNISGNVANLNTPGFKRSQALFEDLMPNPPDVPSQGGSGAGLGNGVDIRGTTTIFTQGELRQTGNDLDAAVDGNGMFIVRQDGKTLYTRAGQFEIDKDGFLVERGTTARVAVLDGGSGLQDLNIQKDTVSPASATTSIKLDGNLSRQDADGLQVISGITAHDSSGASHTLKVSFTNVDPFNWSFQVQDAAGKTVASGAVTFQADGSLAPETQPFSFSYTPAGGTAQTLSINLGTPGKFSGLTNFSSGTDSSAKLLSADGYASGGLTKTTIATDGSVVLTYANGQTVKRAQLALAWFGFQPKLSPVGGNMYEAGATDKPVIGGAQSSVFGKVTGGSIESSNVDLTQQFSELIIMQRGYQASSQVITTANDMIQQLLDTKSKR